MINDILSRATKGQPTPEVGMGATVLMHSDRRAATIIEILKVGQSTILTVQNDNATRVSGSAHDGSARYEFSRNPRGSTRHFRAKLPDGRWQEVMQNPETGRWIQIGGTGLRIGERDHYIDPHF